MTDRGFAARICEELAGLRSEGAPLDALLKQAVESLHEERPQFDWTGIYELFPDAILRLGPFIGAPTDHVFIGVGEGVCDLESPHRGEDGSRLDPEDVLGELADLGEAGQIAGAEHVRLV